MWVIDQNLLIFNQERVKTFEKLPKPEDEYTFVLGVDLGFSRDYNAIVVLAWHEQERKTYLVEETQFAPDIEKLDHLADKIKILYDKYTFTGRPPIGVSIDTGGTGKKISEILQFRYGVVGLSPAKKQDKMAHIEEMRNELHAGRFLLKKDSEFLEEMSQIIYDEQKEKISDQGLHSHLLDAALYAYRFVTDQFPKSQRRPLTYAEKRIQDIIKKSQRKKLGKGFSQPEPSLTDWKFRHD